MTYLACTYNMDRCAEGNYRKLWRGDTINRCHGNKEHPIHIHNNKKYTF